MVSQQEMEARVRDWSYLVKITARCVPIPATMVGWEVEDNVAAGYQGLMVAARTYDASRRTTFKTHAINYIRFYIKKGQRDYRRDWKTKGVRVYSLDAMARNREDESYLEQRESSENVYRDAVSCRLREQLLSGIAHLTEREQEIMWLYYMEERRFTINEIAEMLGISRQRVSQITQASIKKLRGLLREEDMRECW